MKTQIELAREGVITPQMEKVAVDEDYSTGVIRQRVAMGEIVIPNNPNRPDQIIRGIGTGLRTKVNASIGTSSDICNIDDEVRKAIAAEEEGADTLMELSAGGNLDKVRREVLAASRLPVGNVPLYQAFKETARLYRDPSRLDPEYLFDLIEQQLCDGLSFMAIHCGINQYTIERLRKQGYRYGGLCSKGGTFMVAWMDATGKDNPLYEQFDRVCGLMKKYDAVLSLGNGIRAGAIHDSHDRAQMAEMIINCELAEIGREMGCQMMVEGPGHVPIDEIEGNIMLEKRMSGNAPVLCSGADPPGYRSRLRPCGRRHRRGAFGQVRSGPDLLHHACGAPCAAHGGRCPGRRQSHPAGRAGRRHRQIPGTAGAGEAGRPGKTGHALGRSGKGASLSGNRQKEKSGAGALRRKRPAPCAVISAP